MEFVLSDEVDGQFGVRRTNDPSKTDSGLPFAEYLLKIGEGRRETAEGYDAEYAKIPDDIALSNDYDEHFMVSSS